MNEEMLFDALSEVGDDLLVMAERKRFVSPWRKWGQTAAILAVVVCLGALALPYFPMGCGASTEKLKGESIAETTAQTTQSVAEEAVVAEEEMEEAEEEVLEEGWDEYAAEDAKEEIAVSEPQEAVAAQALTKVVCRGTWFYLEPVSEDMGVPPLGEELGAITDADDPELVGCRVFTVPYSTWFSNHAVDGPVTQMVYVQTMSGYRYGFTCNEKVVSRYSMDDVRMAVEEENWQWLADTFVQPIECAGGVQFTDISELSSEELNTIFLSSTVMNTGVVVSDHWLNEAEGNFVVPISDVLWRLDRFLDEGYVYDPAETEYYDEGRHAMVCPVEKIVYDKMEITVHSAQVLEGDRLFLLISLPDQKGVTKEYIIRFDEDSWRYETINEIGPG